MSNVETSDRNGIIINIDSLYDVNIENYCGALICESLDNNLDNINNMN